MVTTWTDFFFLPSKQEYYLMKTYVLTEDEFKVFHPKVNIEIQTREVSI